MQSYFYTTLRKSLLIVAAMSLVMMILCAITLGAERAKEAEKLSRTLEDGVSLLQSQAAAMQSALYRINENEHVMRMLQLVKMQLPYDYYHMKRAQEYVNSIAFANAYAHDMMLMFRNNGIVLTRYGSFDTFADFTKHYQISCIGEIRKILEGHQYNLSPAFFPEAAFSSSFTPERRRVLCYYFSVSALPGSNEIVALVFFDVDRLLADILGMPLPEGGSFSLQTAAGLPLLQSGAPSPAGGTLDIHVEGRTLSAELSLPGAWLGREIGGLVKLNLWFLCIALLAGIGLSIYVAWIQSRPVKKLLAAVLPPEADERHAKEISFVHDEILRMNQQRQDAARQLDSMRETLKQTMMDRLLTRPLSDEEQEQACQLIGDFPAQYAVCAGCLRVEDEVISQSAYLHAIQARLPRGALFHQLSPDSFALLCPGESREAIVDSLLAITQTLQFGETPSVLVAVSRVVQGPHAARDAFDEAYKALSQMPFGAAEPVFLARDVLAEEPFTMQNLLALYRALISGSSGKAVEMLERLHGGADIGRASLYYTIHAVILLAARDTLRQHVVEPLSYVQNPHRQLAALNRLAADVCAHVHDEKKSHNDKLRQGILEYIHENFADPDLYGRTIADHFHISGKYLYNFMKEQTGCSVNDYLTQLRLRRACDLLSDTSLPVGQIYSQSGFLSPNTLYKVFKREFGVSPTEYRKRGKVMEQ